MIFGILLIGYIELKEKINNMSLSIEVSKIVDKYIPAEGVGTETEKVRESLHKEISMLVIKYSVN